MKLFQQIGMECLGLELKLMCLKTKKYFVLVSIDDLREERNRLNQKEESLSDQEWSRKAGIGSELTTLIRHCHRLEAEITELDKQVVSLHKAS